MELARTVRLAGGSRSVPAGPDYDNKPVSRSVGPRSSSHEITWSDSTAGSATFNSEAAAEGIRGTAGVVGIPGAEGIVDRVRRIRRAETGLSRLSGLCGLSCWPDRETNQKNQRDQRNQTDQRDQMNQRDERDSRSTRRDLPRGRREAGAGGGRRPTWRVRKSGTTSGFRLLPTWKTAQAGRQGSCRQLVPVT